MGKAKSQLPLIDRIDTLKADIILTNRHNIKFNKEKISKEEENKKIETIIKDFYKKNSLLHKVAAGKKSYSKLFEPVIGKSNSLLNIIFHKKDDKFDRKVIRVIKSMNNVGVYIEPYYFTTKGIKEYINKKTVYALFTGSLFACALLVRNSLRLSEIPGVEPISLVEKVKYISPLFIAPYTLFMIKANSSIKDNINKLKKTAKEADDFLKKHYIK